MAKGLLLGNGINARIGINELSVKDIGQRFFQNLEVYAPMIENVFGVVLDKEFTDAIEKSCKTCGIETLAGFLYKYIKDSKKSKWTDNDEYRVQDMVSCICLSSIFFTDKGKIKGNYDKSKMVPVDQYDYVFTLNYVEFWDSQNKCIYLHGHIDFSGWDDFGNAILVSKDRMAVKEYKEAIYTIKNPIIEFRPNKYIFAPEGIEKNKLICVMGIFPSDRLYSAKDLFMYSRKKLYTELDKVEEIDIFGMSPYGDKSLIDVINNKRKVRVYIYNKNQNEQTAEWANLLKCHYELLDSEDI